MATKGMTEAGLSRRRLLVGLAGTAGAFHGAALAQRLGPLRRKRPAAPTAPVPVYFGTDTSRGISKGIYFSRFDVTKGQLTAPALVASIVRPAYLAVGTARGTGRRVLYAAAEGTDASSSAILSFVIDPKTGGLLPLNRVSAGGVGPAYLSLDASGESAYAANYAGGTVASFRILPDGKLTEPVERLDFRDEARYGVHGPNTRQDGPHPHSTTISPDDRFLLVNDLGKDAIEVFPIDTATGHMGEMEPHRFNNNHPGSGPRHVAFHPNGRWVYNLNEIDATIDRFLWQTTHRAGQSQALLVETPMVAKLLAPEFSGKNTSAELAISPDGFYLYASNRGEDTLVVFSIEQTTGDLTLLQRIGCGGKAPRHFTLSPGAEWLVCGNQDSATVTVFRRDGSTGRLTGPVQSVPLDSPMFTLFA